MDETTECPLCGARYRNAEVHRRLHEEADKTEHEIDQAVDERLRGREHDS